MPVGSLYVRKPIGATWNNNLMHKLYGGRHIILFGGRHIINLCGGRHKRLHTAKWQNTTRAAGCLYVYPDFIMLFFVKLQQKISSSYPPNDTAI